MRVEVEILDPGHSPAIQWGALSDLTQCYEPVGTGSYMPADHTWTPLNIGEGESTWYCSRCRRIEKRVLIQDDAE